MNFSGSPKGTPHDWCRRTMKKNYPEAKKCSICWVSHMFSIWEYRYSYGICFGTVYALRNSTPNISTPNILSFFSVHTRRVEIGHILCRRSWLYIYIYISHEITMKHRHEVLGWKTHDPKSQDGDPSRLSRSDMRFFSGWILWFLADMTN